DSIGDMARVLKPKAPLFIASDIDSNIGWTLAVLDASPDFVWTAEMPHDWQAPPAHWQSTRYEQKAIREGRTPCYLYFERK
ncbi:MAG: tRNA (guanosine(46)-N7)-methyltransferase TrmB, partial [Parvibaculales bacterium]